MKELFQQYAERFESLTDLMQDELPRSLRLFNIRLRLALDIQISFKGEVSLTKTKSVRDTYIKIIKLTETWNAYEALFHYAKDLGKYANPKANKAKIYTQALLSEVGSLSILKGELDTMKGKYDTSTHFKKDINQYIQKIIDDKRLRSSITEDAKSFIAFMKDRKSISGIELLSLIYAERNMYYHNGETAKMGMRYSNRKQLLDHFNICLTKHTLLLSIFILDKEIKENE